MTDANLLVLVGEDDDESSSNNNAGDDYYCYCYDKRNDVTSTSSSMMLLPSDVSNSSSSSSTSSTITTSVASSTWRIMSKKNDEQERTATMTSSFSKNYTTITSRTHLSISQGDDYPEGEAYDEDGDSSLTKSTYCQYQHCPRPNNNNKNGNSKVLGFAFYSFFIFTCVQAFYAIQSHSSSLLADTAAMFVDAGTYLFNMLAETWKASSAFSETMSMISSSTTKTTTTTSTTTTRLNLAMDEEEALNHDDDDGFGNDTTVVTQRERTTTSKLHTLYLELLPPFVSVVALLYITCISLMDAIVVLYEHYYLSSPHNQEEENNNDDDDDEEAPNTKIMMVFAFVALVIDLLNVSCFSRAETKHTQHTTTTNNNNNSNSNNKEALCHGNSSPNKENNNATLLPSSECTPLISYQQSTDAFDKEMTTTRSRNSSSSRSSRSSSSSNMNMYSAWTHVFADTLRSTAILLAGALSHFYPNFVLPVISDAIATIIVSCTIFFSCIPLVKGLNETWHGICSLKSEIHHREREEK